MVVDASVKKGFKQTDLGVIPEDWEIIDMGSIIESVIDNRGKTPPLSDVGYPLLEVNSIYKQGKHPNYTNVSKYVSKNTYLHWFRNGHPTIGDVLIATVGSAGSTAIMGENRGSIAQNIVSIKVEKSVSNDYFYYFTKTRFFADEVKAVLMGGVQPSLKVPHIKNFKIILPPTKADQMAIATVLSETDELIEHMETLIAKKKAIKQGTMQQLLTGQKRLPGFNGGWGEKKLGDMGKCYRGVSYNPISDLSLFDRDTTFRLFRSNNIQAAKIIYSDMQYVDEMRVSAVQQLRKDDILICMANGSKELVGKAAKFSSDDEYVYTFGAFMGCFRPNKQIIDPGYVFQIFQTEKYKNHILLLLAGSSINNLRPNDLEDLSVSIPIHRDEQEAIAAVLNDTDAEIEILEQKRDKYVMIKQGMMQQLLTGKIRIYANS